MAEIEFEEYLAKIKVLLVVKVLGIGRVIAEGSGEVIYTTER